MCALTAELRRETGPWADSTPGRVIQARIARFAPIAAEVGAVGWVESPTADPYYLAAVAWRESRLDAGAVALPSGESIGLMQLHRLSPRWLPGMDPTWEGVTLDELWIPETNVAAAYSVLEHLRMRCGSEPTVWLISYRYGRCVRPDGEGRERRRLAARLMTSGGNPPAEETKEPLRRKP